MVERSPTPLDRIYHALSDVTRRRMLRDLAERERTVGELAAPHPMSLAAASKHVKVLERAGLITREIRWREHWCRLNAVPLAQAHDELGFYEQFWTDRLGALDRLLRDEDARAAAPPSRKPAKPPEGGQE